METHLKVLSRLTARVVNTPLAIAHYKLQAILQFLGARIGLAMQAGPIVEPAAGELPALTAAAKTRKPRGNGDSAGAAKIAVIPVHDTLVHRSMGFDGASGLTSYEAIRSWFQEALADPEVQTILFDIDSPGGEVAGLFDLVDEIRASRGTKPICAIANEEAYSAAYAIASAAERIFVPRTGGLGSIGVIAMHVDQSQADRQEGLHYDVFTAGARKADFNPHDRLSPEARRIAQQHVDAAYELFVNTVARNRKLAPNAVRETEAAIYRGQDSVDIGLADEIASWEEVIAKLVKEGGDTIMTKDAKDRAAAQTAAVEAPAAPEPAAGVAESAVGELLVAVAPDASEIKAEAKKEAVRDFKEIRELCEPFVRRGHIGAEFARKLVEEGLSVDQAKTKLLITLAEKSEQSPIRSSVSALGAGEASPLIADAERRKAAASARKS